MNIRCFHATLAVSVSVLLLAAGCASPLASQTAFRPPVPSSLATPSPSLLARTSAQEPLTVRGQDGGMRPENTTSPLIPPANGAASNYDPSRLVAEVRIVGNETTEERFIQSQLRTKVDRQFDPQMIQSDAHRLAGTRKFYDVKTYTQDTPRGVIVTFEVFELPTIREIRFHGNRGIQDKALAKQDGLEVGESMNRYAIEEARRKIEEYYHSKGFSNCQVFIRQGLDPNDRVAEFEINEGYLQRIASVEFFGNSIASDGRLKTQVKAKPGFLWYLFRGKVDHKQIEEDIERLTAYYRNLGYFNARVGRELEFSESGRWLDITYVIDEGPRYVVRNVSVLGNKKFATEDLLAKLELKSGEFFNLGEMKRDERTLLDIYGAYGHIYADVKADPRFHEEPGQLDLVYKIEEGGVAVAGTINVHIEGEHPHTRESVVRTRLSIRPGDVIDMRELRASERRLKSSQLFANDPATGKSPKIEVRPPELQESLETFAESRASSPSYRGQSPDPR